MIWNSLLQLHEQLRIASSRPEPRSNCATVLLSPNQGKIPNKEFSSTPEIQLSQYGNPSQFYLRLENINGNADALSLTLSQPFEFISLEQQGLSVADQLELALYLPYALLPWFAQQQKRSFAISHFAQTLDGRIAASSGDSKWIGNTDNLTHAHKMRALCDAILVGSNTLRADQPQLSVRRVTGRNPVRILLGNNCPENDISADNSSPLLWINTAYVDNSLEQLTLSAINGKIDCVDIMTALYQRGIYSVYIEGGAATTSYFIQSAALDQVQIHLSPKILGSGITGFDFPGVESMQHAVNFDNPRFIPIGKEIMFVGEMLR